MLGPSMLRSSLCYQERPTAQNCVWPRNNYTYYNTCCAQRTLVSWLGLGRYGSRVSLVKGPEDPGGKGAANGGTEPKATR